VNVITTLQSEAIKKVSFYTLTTKFAKELKADKTYDSVQVTGHSLGGGLAIITGAQAKIPAIALSGPNALISGRSFDPPVTEEQLNRYTFNIIPNRDVVAMLDDKADQFQYIRCNAAKNDLVGCHTTTRSLCQIMTTCGSGNRPAFCECATMFGFDLPTNDGDEDFATLCGT
jgi:lipase ATG15